MTNPLFEKYLKLLLKWNTTYNLTNITDATEIRIKHFEDSLAPLPFLPLPCRLLDVGTGAGFPGIPLKLVRPDLEAVLLDAQRKKVAFCEAAIRELGLEGIKVCHGRAEDSKVSEKLGKFDVIISRATFSVEDFLIVGLPFAKPKALGIAMKGPKWEEEMIVVPEWELQKVHRYVLSQEMGERTLLIFSKRNPS